MRIDSSGATVLRVLEGATPTERLRLTAGMLLVGDTANANMTVGLTLNQGANDNQILALKSSDVATGITTGTLVQDVETDDYYVAGKLDGATGGFQEYVLAASTLANPYLMEIYGGAPATTDTSTSLASGNFFAAQHNGANALADMAANSNAFAWGEIDSLGARQTRMLLKADDGELHLGNTTLVALQDHDDDALVTDFETFRTTRQSLPALAAADADGMYTRLRDLNLIGAVTAVEWAQGVRPLMNMQRLIHLLAGSSRQAHAVADLVLDDLLARRSLTPQERARIPAGIRQRKGL